MSQSANGNETTAPIATRLQRPAAQLRSCQQAAAGRISHANGTTKTKYCFTTTKRPNKYGTHASRRHAANTVADNNRTEKRLGPTLLEDEETARREQEERSGEGSQSARPRVRHQRSGGGHRDELRVAVVAEEVAGDRQEEAQRRVWKPEGQSPVHRESFTVERGVSVDVQGTSSRTGFRRRTARLMPSRWKTKTSMTGLGDA